MSAVVSNTSPISNLAFIDRLDLLKLQFAELWIPPAVAAELKAHPSPAALAAIDSAIHDHWIRIATLLHTPLQRMLLLQVHPGEAEAIALAVELAADTLIIDEQEGRELATQAGLFVTGTLGVLLLAKQSGHIAAVKPEIQALRTKARFFMSASLEAQVLATAGEE
jgi:predicted nucleic acid-binding protein